MPRRSKKKSLPEMCDSSRKGYVLNCGEDIDTCIHSQTIIEARDKTEQNMLQCIYAINDGWEQCDKQVDRIYIGKSYIRERKSKEFDPSDCSTWKLDGGINGRYRDHVKKKHIQGLIVVAVVTEDSIPQRCKAAGCIINREKYVLKLEKRLIETLKDRYPDEVINKTTLPGRRDKTRSIGYVIYMAYTIGCINWKLGPGWPFIIDDDESSSSSSASSSSSSSSHHHHRHDD